MITSENKTKKKLTSIQKTLIASGVILAVALIGIIVYFAVIAPALRNVVKYVPQLLDGEELYGDNTILMVKLRERKDVASISVSSKTEEYKLIPKNPGTALTEFYIEGFEDVRLDAEALASEVIHSLMLVTNPPDLGKQDRINERATAAELSDYGLDDGSSPTRVTVALLDGTQYTVVIGNAHPVSKGYYAMIDGRRNVVDGAEYYVVYSLTDYVAADFVVNTSATLISRAVLPVLADAAYLPTDFTLDRLSGDDYATVVKIHTYSDDEQVATGETYCLDMPKGYHVLENTFGGVVLDKFTSMTASDVVSYGENVNDPAVYEKYGLDLDKDRLKAGTEKCFARVAVSFSATLNGESVDATFKLYFGNTYYNAEENVEYRYAYSPYSETIFTVKASDFEFITWRTVRFISAQFYMQSITTLDYMELGGAGGDVRFSQTGNFTNFHVDVTKAGDDAEAIIRSGKPVTFDVEMIRVKQGSFTTTKTVGTYENFRDLYYVLITREYAVDAEIDLENVDDLPSRKITIMSTERDREQSFYRFDSRGQRVVSDGEYVTAIYDGGFIRCRNVTVKVKGSDGSERTLTYPVAYYDESRGRFFLKEEDHADSKLKPRNYEIDENGHLASWSYLSGAVEGEYERTLYEFEIFDVLYDYTDENGNTTKRVNQTYSYVVPKITTYKYRINADGMQTLIDRTTTVSDGLYMRTYQIDKLYSDAAKVIDGKSIDKMSPN